MYTPLWHKYPADVDSSTFLIIAISGRNGCTLSQEQKQKLHEGGGHWGNCFCSMLVPVAVLTADFRAIGTLAPLDCNGLTSMSCQILNHKTGG